MQSHDNCSLNGMVNHRESKRIFLSLEFFTMMDSPRLWEASLCLTAWINSFENRSSKSDSTICLHLIKRSYSSLGTVCGKLTRPEQRPHVERDDKKYRKREFFVAKTTDEKM